jgi:uncharacterized membrane protein required for colicin V production
MKGIRKMTILTIIASATIAYFVGAPIVNAIDDYMKNDNN